jgi:hypothetical protein
VVRGQGQVIGNKNTCPLCLAAPILELDDPIKLLFSHRCSSAGVIRKGIGSGLYADHHTQQRETQ